MRTKVTYYDAVGYVGDETAKKMWIRLDPKDENVRQYIDELEVSRSYVRRQVGKKAYALLKLGSFINAKLIGVHKNGRLIKAKWVLTVPTPVYWTQEMLDAVRIEAEHLAALMHEAFKNDTEIPTGSDLQRTE